ncbi:hypothetical protein [Paenibacillus thiaminolyticus]|nr:hypothetical protein [Paenibacillus thiaminolyticus]
MEDFIASLGAVSLLVLVAFLMAPLIICPTVLFMKWARSLFGENKGQ